MANSKILTAEQERALRQPIDEYVGGIQKEIDALRKDGTTRVVECQSAIAGIKRDKTLSKGEKESEIVACEKELAKAKAVEAKNKDEISKLIAKAESYLKENFDSKYYNAVKASCEAEKAEALAAHNERMAELDKKHKAALAKTSDSTEIKEENYVHKNRISNEKLELEKEYQSIKDKKHEAYSWQGPEKDHRRTGQNHQHRNLNDRSAEYAIRGRSENFSPESFNRSAIRRSDRTDEIYACSSVRTASKYHNPT